MGRKTANTSRAIVNEPEVLLPDERLGFAGRINIFEGISDVSDGLSHIFLLFYRESSVKTVYMQRLW